jgi:hypothetical protein
MYDSIINYSLWFYLIFAGNEYYLKYIFVILGLAIINFIFVSSFMTHDYDYDSYDSWWSIYLSMLMMIVTDKKKIMK